MIVGIIVFSLIAVFVGIMLMPLRLCIDTYKNRYYLAFGHLAKASICRYQDDLSVRTKVLFYTFHSKIDIIRSRGQSGESKPKTAKFKRSGHWNWQLVKELIQSFTVKRCLLNVDTDNYVLNAQLIPVFQLFNRRQAQFRVNFQGKANLWLEVENRLIHIIRPVLKHLVNQYL